MKELFHKYQSRQLQFALGLLAALEGSPELSREQVEAIAAECGLEYADQVLPVLTGASIVERTPGGVRLAGGFRPSRLPLSIMEREYLQFLLAQREAGLFLDAGMRGRLEATLPETPPFPYFETYGPAEWMNAPELAPEDFDRLLRAIRERRRLHYRYCTTTDPTTFRQAVSVPWRLEFDAYTHRWWLIHYDPAQDRMIKSILNNLRDFRLGERTDVTEGQIQAAMDRLLAADGVVLRILPERNALERCAMVFERQMLRQIRQEPDGSHLITFPYYRFDENEILRKLLYLGPGVQLVSPKHLCRKLISMIDEALGHGS